MASYVVMLSYGAAVVLALALLYFLEPIRWYWHVLSVAVAFAIGLAPLPAEWHGPANDLIVGAVFLFLFTWGVCAPLFRKFHHQRERHA
jgi:hypothetical protein